MPVDPEGPHGPLFAFSDGAEFKEDYPELAPLAPIASALQMLFGAGEGPELRQERAERLDAIADKDFDNPNYERERRLSQRMAKKHRQWAEQLENAVERIERFGMLVDREGGRVTLPTGKKGKNVDLLTVAAGMVWESLDVDGYREETEDTDAVPEPLAEKVSDRLFYALHWRFGGERDAGQNSRLRSALYRYVDNPDKYRVRVVRSDPDGAGED